MPGVAITEYSAAEGKRAMASVLVGPGGFVGV